MRRGARGGLVAGLVLLLAACLTQEQQTTAKSVALGDARLQTLLAAHSYRVVRVAPQEKPAFSLDVAIVQIRFTSSLGPSEWPLDVCGTVQDQPFNGVSWMVSLTTKKVLAVTPVLPDGTSC